MNIIIGTVIIGAAAIWMWRALPNGVWRLAAYRNTFDTLKFTFPRILIALLGASFFAELLPTEHMQDWFGKDTGLQGLLMATIVGPITPGGAFVSFAIGAAALKAGAGVANVLAYVTSWTLFSSTRILGYEVPMMGRQTALFRIMICLPIPFLVGLLSGLFLQ
ncbi:hypothetical protein [uncultured Cohaesibacter sp.]|uniref:hypothetical protein n=1 Tax=uncultured Cohaesibacter sp. TaxID=1002546 RepID=UPI00292E80C1|nr:hypothetical protein [uncultured Cohaesibacter sp.]